jgi:capsular polysaccharide biosynthesis protein
VDAEIILRSCWRRRLLLTVCTLTGALLLVIGGHLLVSKTYASSADISVAGAFPPSLVDSSANQVYVREPDRFVATQIEVLSSRGAASAVASDLHLPTQQVADAMSVVQLAKSDVIRVTATSSDPRLSARIAERSATNYLETVGSQTREQYAGAIASLTAQKDAVDKAIAALQARSGTTAEAQNGYRSLVAQQGRLAIDLQHLILASRVAPDTTRVVSRATADPRALGPGMTSLVLYGAILGLAAGLCWVAVTTRPGRTLADMDRDDSVAGVPMLGMVRRAPVLGGRKRRELADIENRGTAGELTRLVQLKGPLCVLTMTSAGARARVSSTLVPAVMTMLAHRPHGWAPDRDADPVIVRSLGEHLQDADADPLVVLAIDVEEVRPSELDSVLTGLRMSGADVVGIIGVR